VSGVLVGACAEPGRPWPLGASVVDGGVNLAVFSARATRVECCVFDGDGRHEIARHALTARTGDIWHGHLAGAGAGLVYGIRAHGPWAPGEGDRFNPAKLLLDPWAREIVGEFEWRDEHRGHRAARPDLRDERDNAAWALKSRVVVDPDPIDDATRPRIAPADRVIYELHVKGFTRLNPQVPAAIRGTYAGLGHPAAIAHLRSLGVTTVSLLPVQQHLDEERLVRQGLTNYWGYNTIGFFCPEPRYAAATGGAAVREEFRAMVRALHDAGIEVLLDVVFNHTAETDEQGPTVSWRGLDNASWYRLDPADRGRCVNLSGCGNTLDLSRPMGLRLALDAMRHWVRTMGVDGFRFDLAAALGRGARDFEPWGSFFQAIAQDPVLCTTCRVAEPWDLGEGGYRLGEFPPDWLEWNDRSRDACRGWWLLGSIGRGEFARRWCASSDRFERPGRAPSASVEYVCSHDGFTLRDLVSHERRHNEANREGNRDGHAHNLSRHFGVEGETDRVEVLALRARAQRALLATVLLGQGTPMLAAGDEIGHSQSGNNNPYCQDNPITWIDWASADRALLDFVRTVLSMRRAHRPLGPGWHHGTADGLGRIDLSWLEPEGGPISGGQWDDPSRRAIGAWRRSTPGDGGPAHQRLVLANAGDQAIVFRLPPGAWRLRLDSARPDGLPDEDRAVESSCWLPPLTLWLLTADEPAVAVAWEASQ